MTSLTDFFIWTRLFFYILVIYFKFCLSPGDAFCLRLNPAGLTVANLQQNKENCSPDDNSEINRVRYSVGSRIFQTGAPPREFGAKTYYLAWLLPKTTWKWKKIDREGALWTLGSASETFFIMKTFPSKWSNWTPMHEFWCTKITNYFFDHSKKDEFLPIINKY